MSDPELAELLDNSLYVDDLISGSDTVESAYNIYEKAKQIMAEGGFNLREGLNGVLTCKSCATE